MLHRATPRLRGNTTGRTGEIGAVTVTAAGKFVFGDWLDMHLEYLIVAVALWTIYIVTRRRSNPSVLRRWGFTTAGLAEAAVLSALALLAGAGFCVVYAVVTRTGIVSWNLVVLLALYPIWGLVQQFLLVALVADNVMAIRKERSQEFAVVMFAALLFSAIHFPEVPLMIATFFLGSATTLIFFRTRNIWMPGVLHGWFATLFYFLVMEVDPLEPLLAVAFGR
ncbi:MAG: hypothetical protein EA382_10695 [Spirochaetaceae bacterium]|nr:MAG: hypothetical protein EA382_10695 [Spirochaetaceae bacterium]